MGKELDLPLLSDVHRFEEIAPAAEVLDILQIPAFLCRQTDFVMEVAKTGRVVNIKKGQFLAPWDIKNAAEKAASTGNDKIIITERGVSFGYNNLVADMRSLPIMRESGLSGGVRRHPFGAASRGRRDRIVGRPEVRAASHPGRSCGGIDALFMEVHACPDKALCDGPNMLSLDELPALLKQAQEIDRIVKTMKEQAKKSSQNRSRCRCRAHRPH